jgi:hypothetical protein
VDRVAGRRVVPREVARKPRGEHEQRQRRRGRDGQHAPPLAQQADRRHGEQRHEVGERQLGQQQRAGRRGRRQQPGSAALARRAHEREGEEEPERDGEDVVGHGDRPHDDARPQQHRHPERERREGAGAEHRPREQPEQPGAQQQQREVEGAHGEDLLAVVGAHRERRCGERVVEGRLHRLVARPAVRLRPDAARRRARPRPVVDGGHLRRDEVAPDLRQPPLLGELLDVGVVRGLVDRRPDVEARDGQPADEHEGGDLNRCEEGERRARAAHSALV